MRILYLFTCDETHEVNILLHQLFVRALGQNMPLEYQAFQLFLG